MFAVRGRVLVAVYAEYLTVFNRVTPAFAHRYNVVRFPSAGQKVETAVFPNELAIAAPFVMATFSVSTLAASAGAFPRSKNSSIGKSHIM